VSTWDEMEEIWLDRGVGDDDFEDLSVGLMDNTKALSSPSAELPANLTPDPKASTARAWMSRRCERYARTCQGKKSLRMKPCSLN